MTSRAAASHFDTHLFVNKLQEQGLTHKQAEGVMNVLAEVIDESIRGMEGGLVSKAEQEKVCPMADVRHERIYSSSSSKSLTSAL
jgi:hypothetical protein